MILRSWAIWSSVGVGHLAVLGSLWSGPSPIGAPPAPLLLDLHLVPLALPASPTPEPPPPASPAPETVAAASAPAAPLATRRPVEPTPSSPLALARQVAGDAGVVTPPRFLARAEPTYPPRARRAGVEGTVTVRLRLSASGHLLAAEVAAASGEPLLDEAALAAARASRYEPATRDGRPVASETSATYRFELR